MYFNEYDNYFRHDCDEVTKSFLREVYDVTYMPDLKSTVLDKKKPLARMVGFATNIHIYVYLSVIVCMH